MIYRKGFKAASLTDILSGTSLTKGALYHHFPNKQAMGLALLDSIESSVDQYWLEPLKVCEDPIEALQMTLAGAVQQLTHEELTLGCPLNNLAQEMSSLDESFRLRVAEIYMKWQEGVEQALLRGQAQGVVNQELDATAAAAFYVAALAGGRGLAKTTRSTEVMQHCVSSINWYLESLRTNLQQKTG